jgi:hypothetical protein
VTDAPGMKGDRSRNADGELRRKRADTHVGAIEQKYEVDFGVRSDMHLGTLLKRERAASLDELLRRGSK